MAITVPVEDFQIGRVVSRTFGVLTRNAASFFIIAIVVMLPMLLVNVFVGSASYLAVGTSKGWVLGALVGLIPLVCGFVLQAALVQGTIADLNGDRPGLGSALSIGMGLVLPVLIIAILSLLGVIVGTVLLIVPGLVLMTGWSVVIPVRVAERTGIKQTFGRSWELTKQYRWKIFGLLVIYFIVALLLGTAARLVTGVTFAQSAGMVNNIPYMVLLWMENVVVTVIAAIGVSAVYYELRTVKEGIAPAQLAAAFD